MDLSKLKDPFRADEVEWRIQSCGKKADDSIWAKALAYVTNRAIMDRLDEVCGPENWQNQYTAGPDGGVLCGISIRCYDVGGPGGWITKWDGADNTNIESTKGGLSDSMKRAAVQWGIGRYLYRIEADWVKIVQERTGQSGKTKDGTWFNWLLPTLPSWALPKSKDRLVQSDQAAATIAEESTINQTTPFPVQAASESEETSVEYPGQAHYESPHGNKPPKRSPEASQGNGKRLSELSIEELRIKVTSGILALYNLNKADPKINEDDEKKSHEIYENEIYSDRQKLIEFIQSMARKINPPKQEQMFEGEETVKEKDIF